MKMALKSYLETQYGLRKNPFPGKATYMEDSQTVYVPEMFGSQRDEFLRKFILTPLENGQPLIGAVWSVLPGDPSARGFGKSTLMGEEAKLINQDFGFSTLVALGVSEEDARNNPILAGYVSFNARAHEAIASIDAAAFHLMRFLLRGTASSGIGTHERLREMAAARLVQEGKASPGKESNAIINAIKERFRQLAVSLDIRNLLEDFVFHLASSDTASLENFLASSVGGWHHNRNGLKYLQVFVVFAELAGVEHITFFTDQVEDFTAQATAAKIQKNVKIIRDALMESEPFGSRASFVFQLHPAAWYRLRDAWAHEDMRDLSYNSPLNDPFVIVLRGLDNFESANVLAERCLNHPDFALPSRRKGITPFTRSSLRLVWKATMPLPRYFLRALHDLILLGNANKIPVLDDAFVQPKLEGLVSKAQEEDDDSPTDGRLI
jgi:hypothetical protein